VAAAARRFGAGMRSVGVDVPAGANLEERARLARYAVLPPHVLTGHTADDQAETVLLALLRGSGLDGLSGMRRDGRRPLLALRRAETLAVCRAEGIDPLVDPSNADPAYRRNRVRAELLPLASAIAQRDVTPLLARTASILRQDADLLDELASVLDPTDVAVMRAAAPPLARRALRRWLAREGDGRPPDAATVERAMAVVGGQVRACEVAGVGRLARTGGRLRVEALRG
jgi:tRNA(Ile)-lysidine synthase